MNSHEEQNVIEQDAIEQNQFGMYTIKFQIILFCYYRYISIESNIIRVISNMAIYIYCSILYIYF